MKNLAPMNRAERVDSWATALLILMVVHTSVSLVAHALEGSVSLLCGLAAAVGYIVGRRWLRQRRAAGHAASAWTWLRIFETAGATGMVFLLCMVIGASIRLDAIGCTLGVLLSLGLAVYRLARWGQQYNGGEFTPQP